MAASDDFQKATTQAKQTFEKMSEAPEQAAHALKETYSSTLNGAKAYQAKVLEFAQANANSAFEYAKQVSSAKSPSEFFELSNHHLRQQFETFSKQANELAMIAQKMTIATGESIKGGLEKVGR